MLFLIFALLPEEKHLPAASFMNNKGKIYAFDIYEHRVKTDSGRSKPTWADINYFRGE